MMKNSHFPDIELIKMLYGGKKSFLLTGLFILLIARIFFLPDYLFPGGRTIAHLFEAIILVILISMIVRSKLKTYRYLYENAERERVLREITSTTGSSLDFNKIRKAIVTILGEFLGSDLDILYLFDSDKQKFLPIDEHSVHLSSNKIENPIGMNIEDYGWGDFFRSKGIEGIVYSDAEKLIKDYNLQGSKSEEFIEKYKIKSTIVEPVVYAENLYGLLAFNFIKQQKTITQEDVNLVKFVANQAGIAIYQAKLYENEKLTAERERVLREIIETMRSSLDIDKILNFICDEAAKLFNVQRASIFEIPDLNNLEAYVIRREYTLNESIKGISDIININLDYITIATQFWNKHVVALGEIRAIDNITESDIPDLLKQIYEQIGVKSFIGVPISSGDDKWGGIFLSEYNYFRHWTEDEINLLKTIANQAYIAIQQAKLYEKEKQTAEREKILRNIIEALKTTLDLQEIKRFLVENISLYFKADRCFIHEYDSERDFFLPIDTEYLSSPDVKSALSYNISVMAKEFTELVSGGENNIIKDAEKFIEENRQSFPASVQFLIDFDVKSDYGFGIFYQNTYMGGLIVHFTKEKRELTDEELDFLQSIVNAAGAAIYQAKLYEKINLALERERVLREIIETMRSTLDINQIKKNLVTKAGKIFNADRCHISYITEEGSVSRIDEYSEYLSSPEVKSFIGDDPNEESTQYWIQAGYKENLNIPDLEKYLVEHHLEGTPASAHMEVYNNKSVYSIRVFYAGKVTGLFILHYTKKPVLLTDDDLRLLESIADQTGIALYQAKLYEKQQQTAEKEKLLRKTIESMRSTLNIKEIKKLLTKTVATYFKADRCFIFTYDHQRNTYLPITSEYLSSSEINSLLNKDISEEALEFVHLVASGKNNIIKDSEKFINENKETFPVAVRFLENYNIKSDYGFGLFYKNLYYGALVVHFVKDKKNLSDDEINFLELFVNQAAVALYQAELYENQKQTAEREALLRKITEIIRSSLNIDDISEIVCEELAKIFNADMTIVTQHPDTQNLSNFIIKGHYISPESQIPRKGPKEIDPRTPKFWAKNTMMTGNILVYDDLANSAAPEFIKESYEKSGIKSVITAPIKQEDKKWGTLGINSIKVRHWKADDIDFLESIANQIYIAIYQAELYENQKQLAEREKIIRETIEILRISLDSYEIKKQFIEIIRNYFDADRSLFAEYDRESNVVIPFRIESLKSPEDRSVLNLDVEKLHPILANKTKMGKNSVIRDVPKTLLKIKNKDKLYEEIKRMEKGGIKSHYDLAVKYKDIIYGTLIIDFKEKQKSLTYDEFVFLKILRDQAGIALHQAELYEKEKQTAEREKLIREIIESIRSTMDVNEVRKNIVTSIGKYFKADRCIFVDISEDKLEHLPVNEYSEYRISPEIESLVGVEYDVQFLHETQQIIGNKKVLSVWNTYEYIRENNIENSSVARFIKKYNIQSILVATIEYQDKLLGTLAIHFITKKVEFTKEDIGFLHTVASQAGIAFQQAILYRNQKQTAEREALINKVVGIIAGEPDILTAKYLIMKEICTTLNADRCYFRAFDKNKKAFLPPEVEYISSPDTKSLIGISINQEGLRFFFEEAEKQKSYTPLIVNQKLIDEKNLRNTPLNEYFEECGIKTDIAIPMWDKENELSFMVMHYKEDVPNITEEEAAFMETLAKQIIIAIDRANLLENTKKLAEREKVLRELVGEIRLSQNVNEVYRYITIKIADIFGADRVFLSEINDLGYVNPRIKLEYVRKQGLKPMTDIDLPANLLDILMLTKEQRSSIIIDDLRNLMPENSEVQTFFDAYGLTSALFVPLAKYGTESRVLGILALIQTEQRTWTKEEQESLLSITEATVRVIWEINKIREINELRDIFTMTLAHDLQIPLIAEKKALEFMLSRPSDRHIGDYKEFLTAMARENAAIIGMLNRLLYIYSYEGGRKRLNLVVSSIFELIEDIEESLKSSAGEKSISILINKDDRPFNVYADREEIKKVIHIILENAITFSPRNSTINISCYLSGNNVVTAIKDEGTGIPQYIREKLFKRYQMVEIIERKIGSGLGLYLAKLIVEAHGGKIWYETALNKGSTFYFSLPVIK